MRADYLRFSGVLIVAILAGLIFQQMWFYVSIALAFCLVWQQRNLNQLLKWLRNRKKYPAPDYPGVFEAVCCEIENLRNRQKKRKKKLAGYLKQFQEATSALPDATMVLGPYDEIRWANRAAAVFLGIQWPHDNRQRIGNLLRNPQLTAFLNQRHDGEDSIELPSPAKPGIQLSIRIVPYGKNQRLFVARDVTRLQQLIEIRRDFVANVSHELKTPLTVIRGYIETLKTHGNDDPAQLKIALQQIDNQTLRMQNVVNELILLSKLEQEDQIQVKELVVVPEMLGNIMTEAKELSGDSEHVFELSVEPALWIYGDQSELYSAFSNLVFNAVRYTADGGIIQIRWYADEMGAHLEVVDTGVGIPEHLILRITERFFRVDPSRSRESGGTGLGLAIVKHVLHHHNAVLHIKSLLDKGSTFRCDFPKTAIAKKKDVDQLAPAADP